MDLLKFYIDSLFGFLSFPSPADICQDETGLKDYCITLSSFAFYFPPVLLLICIFSTLKTKLFGRLLLFSLITIPAIFIYTDEILKNISNPANYGFELFVIIFYSWCLFYVVFFSAALLFKRISNNLFLIFLPITIISSFAFVYYGRGSFEQATSLLGGIFIEITPRFFLKSNLVQLGLFSLILTCVYGLFSLTKNWVAKGNMIPELFFENFRIFSLFIIIVLTPLISLPFGALKNAKDVEKAKNFIDDIAKKATKYYYENGEYPRIIDEFINKTAKTPRLLKRHEFFTYGIKGTYYFSRPEKFCFLFQNPAQKFGYYSLTSTREWRFTSSMESYDDVYIQMCDESLQGTDQLISNHLGMENPDDFLNSKAIEFNSPNILPESKLSSQELDKKIQEYGKEHPEIFQYYGGRPENYKELIKEKYGF